MAEVEPSKQRGVQPFAHLVKQVKEMACAEPQLALEELKQPFVGDFASERDQQLTEDKRKWMLSVLHHLDRTQPGKFDTEHGEHSFTGVKQQILAIHESKCTVSPL